MRRGFLAGAAAFAACGGKPPGTDPDPSPVPSPSPSPEPLAPYDPPLGISGRTFIDAQGRNARLMGIVGCCVDDAWPQNDGVSVLVAADAFEALSHGYRARLGSSLLMRAAAAGFNWSHIRLGPDLWNFGERFNVYERVGNKVDLARWDPAFWPGVRATVETLAAHRFYVEVDLVDSWLLKFPEIHPWAKANNVQGFDGGDRRIVQRAPHSHALAFVREAVRQLGGYPNVVWQISNESNVIGASDAWESGIVAAIRAAEGGNRHLVGSNIERDAPWADYQSYHTREQPAPVLAKPSAVNEFNPSHTPDAWNALYRRARNEGTTFHLWLSDASEQDIAGYLAHGRQIREEENLALVSDAAFGSPESWAPMLDGGQSGLPLR